MLPHYLLTQAKLQMCGKEVSMKKKYWIISGISLLCLAILLGGALSYILRPLHYRQPLFACTLGGDVIELEMDVFLQRHLWKPIEAHGKITIDGTEYVSHTDLYPQAPIQGADGDFYLFYVPTDNIIMDEPDSDRLFIMPIGENLDSFWFGLVKSGETETYFCPAGSQDEAQVIAGQLTTR